MNSTPALSGSHLRTYEAIFRWPESQPLEWRAVRALLENLGHVAEEPNGNLKVTRNGHIIVLHPPRTKEDVASLDELTALRQFLEQSAEVPPVKNDIAVHWLLVIDHHEARIFRAEIRGAIPEQILPHAPADNFRQAPNSQNFTRGKEKPDPSSFFEPVARALQAGGPILVFGTGTGMSSEMDQFMAWAKLRHPDLADRIIGSAVVDEHHLTEGQLLAKAREVYGADRRFSQ